MFTRSTHSPARQHYALPIGPLAAAACAVLLLTTCSEPTAPGVLLQLRGTVRQDATPLPGARVLLLDRRSALEAGVTLGTATTNGTGGYMLDARAQRTGYTPGCDFLILFVENFEFATTPSTPLRCVTGPQTIDLTVTP